MCEIELVGKVVCVCYLGCLSWLDVRTRKLPIWILGAGAILALLYQLLQGRKLVALWLLGAAIGLGFLLVGKATGEAMGYGDAMLIGVLGIYLGIWDLLGVLVVAFFLSALYAAGALVARKFRRKTAFPFVPFLGVAYVILLVSEGW